MRVFRDPANPHCAQPWTPHLQGGPSPDTDMHTALNLSLELVEAYRDLNVLSLHAPTGDIEDDLQAMQATIAITRIKQWRQEAIVLPPIEFQDGLDQDSRSEVMSTTSITESQAVDDQPKRSRKWKMRQAG